MDTNILFSRAQFGALRLVNRIVMAPLTRNRADAGHVPGPLSVEYYRQRATAGLIITEATGISAQGRGIPGCPGIYTEAQVAGWRAVTDAVHASGGRIVLQLWHAGAYSHSSFQPDGARPVAPSAVRGAARYRPVMNKDFVAVEAEVPRALELAEIPGIIADYHRAARNAKRAGFDGVEVHCANGYLIDQFLHDSCNQRSDEYGGSLANRCRMLREVVQTVIDVWGGDRVGVRLSPHNTVAGLTDSAPERLYAQAFADLDRLAPAYLHLVDPRASGATFSDEGDADAMRRTVASFRAAFTGPVITAGGYTYERALDTLRAGDADAVAFGRFFIANPDLVERFRSGAPLNPYDRSTFYTAGAKGYTDYPVLARAEPNNFS